MGSTYIEIDDDPATSDIDLNGNHIGFTVMASKGNNPRLGLLAHLLYQESRGANELRRATLSWLEWQTEASLAIDLDPAWTLNAGAGFVGIDARRRVSGDISETLQLKGSADFQGRLGIDLNTHPDGRISLVVHRGVQNGTGLVFAREF